MSPASPDVSPRAAQNGPVEDEKWRVRAQVRAARAADPLRARSDADRLPRLLAACRGHATVACYFSVPPEPDTVALVQALSDAGVQVLLPVLKGRREPAWNWYTDPSGLVSGLWGIPEPIGEPLGADALAACSFVWVSALCVTPGGFRLGTGGGWYDRALTHADPDAVRGTLVGDQEVVEAVPLERWDLPVDLIVTPTRSLETLARGVRLPATE